MYVFALLSAKTAPICRNISTFGHKILMIMTQEQRKELLKNQQGELDAVIMYQRLANVVKTEREREALLQLAREEGRHASVFHAYTGEALTPKKTLARIVTMLYRLIGQKRLYKIIARNEYAAFDGYEHLIADFPEVDSVRHDEKRHGDIISSLI